MIEDTYRFIALGIFLVGSGISIHYRRRADRGSGERISLRAEQMPLMIALRVAGLALWLGVLAYLINPQWMAWSQIQLPAWLRWGGAALGIIADALILWVFSSIGNNVTPTVVTRREHKLVTTGPYRYVRHPLYSTGFLSLLSFSLLAANWYVALLAVLSLVLLSARVPREEAELVARNGAAYLEYARRTGRFFPRLD